MMNIKCLRQPEKLKAIHWGMLKLRKKFCARQKGLERQIKNSFKNIFDILIGTLKLHLVALGNAHDLNIVTKSRVSFTYSNFQYVNKTQNFESSQTEFELSKKFLRRVHLMVFKFISLSSLKKSFFLLSLMKFIFRQRIFLDLKGVFFLSRKDELSMNSLKLFVKFIVFLTSSGNF